jgi:hypothetical protein
MKNMNRCESGSGLFKVLFSIYLEGLRKTTKILRIACFGSEIRIRNSPNIAPELEHNITVVGPEDSAPLIPKSVIGHGCPPPSFTGYLPKI